MKVIRAQEMASRRGAEKKFAGTVWLDPLLEAETPSEPRAYRVFFEPGAHTHWHAHRAGQVLYVLSGTGRVQRWGEPGHAIEPGDVVYIAPGEKHWHGAGPAGYLIHLAFSAGETEWLEPVSEAEYAHGFEGASKR